MSVQDQTKKAIIHPSAIISSTVRIKGAVEIGPFCVVEGDVTLHDGAVLENNVTIVAAKGHEIIIGHKTVVRSQVVIRETVRIGDNCLLKSFGHYAGNLKIGNRNTFGAHVSIGDVNQDKKHVGPALKTVIGDDNTFFEGVVVHCGSSGDKQVTTIGNRCHIMDGAHIAHDCVVMNDTTIGNDVKLGGHVTIEPYVAIGAGTGVHQFCVVGQYSYIGGCTRVVQDVPPFVVFMNRLGSVNITGLSRNGFKKAEIRELNKAFSYLFNYKKNDLVFTDRLKELAKSAQYQATKILIDFVNTSITDKSRRHCYTRVDK